MSKALENLKRRYPSVIESISDERDTGDGWWLYLHAGYRNAEGDIHFIHEDTVAEVLKMFRKYVRTCDCDSCKARLK